MLVLSRKVGEQIVVGDGIVITVVRMGQGSVRIGVEAPNEMAIMRQELIVEAEQTAADENPTAGPATTDVSAAVTPADTLSFFI
jgi:carbon storage regulator